MKPIKRIVATVGKYTDRDGNEKNRYLNIGTLFERPNGKQTVKIDCLPVGEWNGWANFYDIDSKGNEPRSAAAKSVPAELDDDLPF